jgi:hypothetical protein
LRVKTATATARAMGQGAHQDAEADGENGTPMGTARATDTATEAARAIAHGQGQAFNSAEAWEPEAEGDEATATEKDNKHNTRKDKNED